MKCPRCSGLLVTDYFTSSEALKPSFNQCHKCVNCGHREDAVYLTNRRQSVLTELVREAEKLKLY